MAERLNKIYVDGLTRFETRGKSTSAFQHPQKPDPIISKYNHRKDFAPTSKRFDLDLITRRNEDRPGGTTARNEKELMSRSIDKFLYKGYSAYDDKKPGITDHLNSSPFNHMKRNVQSFTPSNIQEYKGLQYYDKLGKYDISERFQKPDWNNGDVYGNYQGAPQFSPNIDLLRKQLQYKGGMNIQSGFKNKQYPEEYNEFKNQRHLDTKRGVGKQCDYDPKSLFCQLNEDPRREAALLGRGFGKEVNRQTKKQSDLDYLKDLGKTYNLGKQYLNRDAGFNYERVSPSKVPNKQYLKDYSAILQKQASIARTKAYLMGKSVGKDHGKDVDYVKPNRYENLRGHAYGQNLYNGQIGSKRESIVGYRGSVRQIY